MLNFKKILLKICNCRPFDGVMPGLLPADADVAFRPNVFSQAFKLSKLTFCNINERSEYSYIRLGDFFFQEKV